ncbi:nb-arc and tpr domain protein [Colletotrichum truncatum]|uniref:Nb-arc and tpr domain protein n=1 Tax=Colletotrichum truncatum TaxID=5467 RepID=A0ACC3ZBG3_COLTU|nr:nb-arc and tpr domain protein [Colletotrichum truncatum]KAF6787675.1 nb-arc and tpr domain protein [Colletotrichum truncatum]
MEAAGALENFPCVVIKGVRDYTDNHKHQKCI